MHIYCPNNITGARLWHRRICNTALAYEPPSPRHVGRLPPDTGAELGDAGEWRLEGLAAVPEADLRGGDEVSRDEGWDDMT